MNEQPEQFDLIVIGAGISGLGLALTALEQGKSVCLVEKSKIAQQTSNNSLRIIHGGFRYLQKLDFLRVYESAVDQAWCLKNYPEHIAPLDCILPLSGKGMKKAALVRVACHLYSAFLNLVKSPIRKPEVLSVAPASLVSIFSAKNKLLCWHDAFVKDPLAFASLLASQIKSQGGSLLEDTECLKIDQNLDYASVLLKNQSQTFQYKAKHVINCSGPQVADFTAAFDCKWALAFNLILNKKINSEYAFAADGQAGRNFFFVPRGQVTVLGTDYYEIDHPNQAKSPPLEKIRDFIASAAAALPNLSLSLEDLGHVEWGVIPVKSFKSASNPDFLGSSLLKKQGRVVHILSTKYTGFRSQALKALKLCDGDIND